MNDALGDRMKNNYEHPVRIVLPWRMPVIIRVDGMSFHSYTKGFDTPFDTRFMNCMSRAMVNLCEKIQTTVFAYTQSDEISLLLHPYKNLNSEPFFRNEVQKLCSISASVAAVTISMEYGKPCEFDSRCFVLPEAEVANYFIWRQKDWYRNSVFMCARKLFSHKQLEGLSTAEVRDMLVGTEYDWNMRTGREKAGNMWDTGGIYVHAMDFIDCRFLIEDQLETEEES
jgi:tRNA(His) 5'-end guanylyltransferase